MDKKKIVLVSLSHLSCDLNGGALPAALPFLRAAHNLDYQATGGLMLAYSCLSSLIQPVLGLLADKLKKPWFIPVGIILAGCGLTILGFMTNYWAMFCAIAISGIGSAFFHPEGARFANRVSGKSKGTGLSIFSIGGNSGFILGPLLVTCFVGTLGLHGLSVFGMIALVMAGIMFWQIVENGAPRLSGQTLAAQKAELKTAEFSEPLAAEGAELAADTGKKPGVNNWHEFGKLTLVIVARSINFTGCNTFIPLYWVGVLGQSRSAGAIALVIFGACGVISNLAGGILSDRFGYARVIRAGFILVPLVVGAFGLVGDVFWAWMLLPALGLALYLPFSSQVVLGQKYLAKNIGFASGVTFGLSTTLGGFAQPLLGWIADIWGLRAIFFCLAAVGCIGCFFAFALSREKADA